MGLRLLLIALVLFLDFHVRAVAQPLRLVAHSLHFRNGKKIVLNIPPGYDISIAAEGLNRLRFMSKSPDGRLFITDMHDLSDNKNGRIYMMKDWDASEHRYSSIVTFASGLHNPNQVAFYTTQGKQYIYIAETDKLTRYEYHSSDTILSGKMEVIANFPDYGLSYKYGGWHLTRSLSFNNGKIYVSVGSSCNACVEKETIRATIMEMNPDGSDKKYFATGLRNSVGIKWVDDKLWVTSMGRDLIGPDKPEDLFEMVERGRFYGWPYYVQYRGTILADKAMLDSAKTNKITVPGKPPVAYCGFKAHSAPLGFDYFKNFNDPQLKNSFLVALHGSTSVWRQRGNAVVKITGKDKYVDVMNGFLTGKEDKDRKGRPCDVMMNDIHSFFVTDDLNGVLYYVWKK